jgi:hypothetical protein
MTETIDELVFKATVQVDDSNLDKVKKQIEELNKGAKQAGEFLGLPSAKKIPSGASTTVGSDGMPRAATDVWTKSERHLNDILNILKRRSQADKSGNSDDKPDSASGAALSALRKNPLLSFAALAIDFFKDVFNAAKNAINKLIPMLDDKLTRELDLHKFSQQTGLSVNALYKLDQQAKLAGTSLSAIVANAQSLQDEMMFGMDEQKAQMMMAMGINPFEMMQEGKSPLEVQEKLFNTVMQATQNMPAMQRASIVKKVTGLEPSDQYGFKHLRDENVKFGAEEIATERGELQSPTDFRRDFVDFNVAMQKVTAAIDKALSAQGVAQKIAVASMEVRSQMVNLITDTINFTGGVENFQNKITQLEEEHKITTNTAKPMTFEERREQLLNKKRGLNSDVEMMAEQSRPLMGQQIVNELNNKKSFDEFTQPQIQQQINQSPFEMRQQSQQPFSNSKTETQSDQGLKNLQNDLKGYDFEELKKEPYKDQHFELRQNNTTSPPPPFLNHNKSQTKTAGR